ncbi:pyruvate carboxylase [Cordyceps militaris CM01]|uniref:Pyruvate carboxylase n=1 Tax=Cordyceps militaris (strain CM01) TaxID=983644 RepID=G3J9P8_CORMM|nr:pyruvate carboxylase [Cordyceps militaris CM01]EGX94971.1 pyruvate carboxylase [Cordyceps militaris CM01]
MTARQPTKVLVANRGEIAARVFVAARELGMSTLAIFAAQDEKAGFLRKADEAVSAWSEHDRTPVEAYLNAKRIVDIAQENQADLVHPGYGFLSENADFAAQVRAAGMKFVGPSTEVLRTMGDKVAARAFAQRLGISTIPGTGAALQNVEEALAFADSCGYPVIVKASHGGGGRGMRVIHRKEAMESAMAEAKSEAGAAFGNDAVFIEKYLRRPQHIEVQVLGDGHGNHIHLFERDCSIQRRHQKIIEMAPAAGISDTVRRGVTDAAVRLARGLNYGTKPENAGTVEFLVEGQDFYFIEMNPRIQVEHTVTEELTGVDLVAAQLRIACGATLQDLDLLQDKIIPRGCSIQCRVVTEIPLEGFRPDTGTIGACWLPSGSGIRLDHSECFLGAQIGASYDSLLLKCICTGSHRAQAINKAIRALNELDIRGIQTNVRFLVRLLEQPAVRNGTSWTSFVDDTSELFVQDGHSAPEQGVLRFLADAAVNGSRIQGQVKPPGLTRSISIGKLTNQTTREHISTEHPCRDGWRTILLRDGPRAFARQVRAHPKTLITDTTWRDGQQSLLATRVRTRDLAAIAKHMSHAYKDAYSLEAWGGATFDVMLRFLHEDPWERLRKLRELVPNIPFQMLLRSTNGLAYAALPRNALFHFVRLAKDTGIDIFRVFDSLNDVGNVKVGIEAVHAAGGLVEGAIMYTGDMLAPGTKYSLSYYMRIVDQLVACDTHILAIKSMSGVLKPAAGRVLVKAIRARYPALPIHMHTHDTNGTGVATMVACVEAGADIVDTAIDSLSGTTSQPAASAVLASLKNTPLECGLALDHVAVIDAYWAQLRLVYAGFDADLRCPDPTVYRHEIPGGQYSNLMFQARQNGLGGKWAETIQAYQEANVLLGDIIKATPTSKAVGDLAQFMVSRGLSASAIREHASTLDLPQSVLEYFGGLMGRPFDGFPEPLRSHVLCGRQASRIAQAGLEPVSADFDGIRRHIASQFPGMPVTGHDVASYTMFPEVYMKFRQHRRLHGDLSVLSTPDFLSCPEIGQEVELQFGDKKSIMAKMLAILPPEPGSNQRSVLFRLDGQVCFVEVQDDSATVAHMFEKARPDVKEDVPSPMVGRIVAVEKSAGDMVEAGEVLLVVSAMKMEVHVSAPVSGCIALMAVVAGDMVEKGDLLVRIEKSVD